MAATRMSSMAPLVSVCIANYNGMEVIDDCLRSVLAQQGDIAVEILVHDDASSDGSLDHIREHYPQVKADRKRRQRRLLHCQQPHGGCGQRQIPAAAQ